MGLRDDDGGRLGFGGVHNAVKNDNLLGNPRHVGIAKRDWREPASDYFDVLRSTV
jgi:hypothetical protein